MRPAPLVHPTHPPSVKDCSLQYKVLDNNKNRRILTPMPSSPPTLSTALSQPPRGSFRALLSDAIRFWEPRRLFYNLALSVVAVAWLVMTWPHFRPALTLTSLLLLVILALLANACYCAAYLVDIPMQHSTLCAVWRRWRWALWLVGTLFAILFEHYWIVDEIYPFVR